MSVIRSLTVETAGTSSWTVRECTPHECRHPAMLQKVSWGSTANVGLKRLLHKVKKSKFSSQRKDSKGGDEGREEEDVRRRRGPPDPANTPHHYHQVGRTVNFKPAAFTFSTSISSAIFTLKTSTHKRSTHNGFA